MKWKYIALEKIEEKDTVQVIEMKWNYYVCKSYRTEWYVIELLKKYWFKISPKE